MANPEFLDVLGDEMGNVYAAAHDRLLINLARHFKYVKDEIISGPNASFQYQARKLAELGQVNRESVDIIMKMMGGGDQALRESLEAAILDSLDDLEPALRQAAQDGLLNGGTVPPEIPVRSMQAFQGYYQQSADKMNLVNSNMLRSTANAYRATVSDIVSRMQQAQRIVNAATGQLIVGADSFNAILKDATAKMVRNGITGLVDDGGHRWAPETYISMVMRTTFHNASREAFFERNAEYTNDLYLVSQHPGARPLCYPWQCKVISRTDNARDVQDGNGEPVHVYAQSETTYGEPAGLFGINCGHYPLPFIPGATKVPEVRQDEEENAKQYAESQKQRGLEREFRKARLDLDVAKAQGADKETIEAAKAKIRRADEKLNRFCNETGRKRRREREYPPVEAKWPEPKEVAKSDQTVAGNDQKVTENDQVIMEEKKALTDGRGNGTINQENETPPLRSLSNKEAREWYLAENAKIPTKINSDQPIEDQARQACELRNQNRTLARDLMADQETRKQLDATDPNRSFEELLADKMQRKHLTRDEAIADILDTAIKSNKAVNKRFGLE